MEKDEPDTISDAGLEAGEYLIVQIGESFSNKQIEGDSIRTKDTEYWFFQVADRTWLNYSPYTLNDSSGATVGSIDSQSGVSYQRLYDGGGDDILRIQDRAWKLYHFSLGVQQDDVRIYPRVPDNQNGGGFDWLSGSEPAPDNGDAYGYIPSEKTEYLDPTIELESISWESASRSPVQFGFYNENPNKPVEPIISVRGWAYELRPVKDEDEMLRLLADSFRFRRNRNNALRQIEFSKSALRSYSYDIPDAWRDVENNLNVSRGNLPNTIIRMVESGVSGGEEPASGSSESDSIATQIQDKVDNRGGN